MGRSAPRRLALTAAAGIVAMSVLVPGQSPGHAPGRSTRGTGIMRVYIGTYTNGASRGIHLIEFDPATGRFAGDARLAGATDQPSYLAFGPGGTRLYAVNELQSFRGLPTGAVSAFAVDDGSGRLTLLNQQPSAGTDPCHLVVDRAGRNVLVANYSSGTAAVLPLSPDGRLRPAASVRRLTGSGPVKARQEGPHAHMILLDAAERFAYWTDLGSDRVLVDRYDAAAGRLEPHTPDSLAITPGSGPRHLAWHPSGQTAYLLNELGSTVAVVRVHPARGALEVVQTVPARAAGARGDNTGAAIHVAPDGRFLYASNRGDDNIAVLAIHPATGDLTPAGHVPSGGRVPRSFAIDPTGRWLIVANQRSASLVVFRIDPSTGLPVATGVTSVVPDPVCVLFDVR